MMIEPSSLGLELDFDRNGIIPNAALEKAIAGSAFRINWTGSGENGKVNISFSFGWDLPSGKVIDIVFQLHTDDGGMIYRNYPDSAMFRRDLVLIGVADRYSNGHLVENPIDRFLINSKTQGLVYGGDGSLAIALQREQPGVPQKGPTGCRDPQDRLPGVEHLPA